MEDWNQIPMAPAVGEVPLQSAYPVASGYLTRQNGQDQKQPKTGHASTIVIVLLSVACLLLAFIAYDAYKADTGPQGIQGEQGPAGDTGAQGPIGLTGPSGSSELDFGTYTSLTSFSSTGTTYDTSGMLNWLVMPVGEDKGFCWAWMEVATLDDPHTWLPIAYSRWSVSMYNNYQTGMGTSYTPIQPDLYYRLRYTRNDNTCKFVGFLIENV
ncbi:hypothetical protein KIPB_004781 [Kipferlia bialata]|uniref:Collagen-like protein n=1 Tax=Kipferlia bialata TaxID=797122 RepID=A0A9K3GII1_9EUKA|nr:hypothetical protein KIPB_004781 [Kipferlia bialata]|eukprot:g4781.t1